MLDLILYHGELSPCAHKVRFVLEERNIEFESRLLNLMAKENLKPEYLAINPKGLVPALVDAGQVVTESTVICEYLEDRFQENPLMPTTPLRRAGVRYWLKFVDEQLHPSTAPILFGSIARKIWLQRTPKERERLLAQVPDRARRERQARLIEHGFDAPDMPPAIAVWLQAFTKMETALADGDWLMGDRITLADCALVPYVYIMRYLRVSRVFEDFPKLAGWMGRVCGRPSFDAAIKPYVADRQWEMIAASAGQAGPALSERFFANS